MSGTLRHLYNNNTTSSFTSTSTICSSSTATINDSNNDSGLVGGASCSTMLPPSSSLRQVPLLFQDDAENDDDLHHNQGHTHEAGLADHEVLLQDHQPLQATTTTDDDTNQHIHRQEVETVTSNEVPRYYQHLFVTPEDENDDNNELNNNKCDENNNNNYYTKDWNNDDDNGEDHDDATQGSYHSGLLHYQHHHQVLPPYQQQQQPSSSSSTFFFNTNNNLNNLITRQQQQQQKQNGENSSSSSSSSLSSSSTVIFRSTPFINDDEDEYQYHHQNGKNITHDANFTIDPSKLQALFATNNNTGYNNNQYSNRNRSASISVSSTTSSTQPHLLVLDSPTSTNDNHNSSNQQYFSKHHRESFLSSSSSSSIINTNNNNTNVNEFLAFSRRTSTSTTSASSSSNPLSQPDWRTLSIGHDLKQFEPILRDTLAKWTKQENNNIRSAVIQVTAPNACGIVRLVPVVHQFTSSQNHVSPLQLPASPNLSRSIVASIFFALVITPQYNIKIVRIIGHDFSEFSHPTTLYNNSSIKKYILEDVVGGGDFHQSHKNGESTNKTTKTCTSTFDHPLAEGNGLLADDAIVAVAQTKTNKAQQTCGPFRFEQKQHDSSSLFPSISESFGSASLATHDTAANITTTEASQTNKKNSSSSSSSSSVSSLIMKSLHASATKSIAAPPVGVNWYVNAANNTSSSAEINKNNNNSIITPSNLSSGDTSFLHLLQNDPFFCTPCVSPFLLYTPKPQVFVTAEAASSSMKKMSTMKKDNLTQSTSSSNNKQQNRNSYQPSAPPSSTTATYTVLDLTHDDNALLSLTFPEQWIFGLSKFVAEVFLMFDGRSPDCRIRHAKKAISVFPSCFLSENNSNSTTGINTNSSNLTPPSSSSSSSSSFITFEVLTDTLMELANTQQFNAYDADLLTSRLPSRRRTSTAVSTKNTNNDHETHHQSSDNNNTVEDECSMPSYKSFSIASAADTSFRADNISRLLFLIDQRVRRVKHNNTNNNFAKFMDFFEGVCSMPLGVIPLAIPPFSSATQQQHDDETTSATTAQLLPPPHARPSHQGANSILYQADHHQRRSLNNNSNNNHNTNILPHIFGMYCGSTTVNGSTDDNNNNNNNKDHHYYAGSRPLELSSQQQEELLRWKANPSIASTVIHVFGNESKRIIHLTPVVLDDKSYADDYDMMNNNNIITNNVSTATSFSRAAASITWIIDLTNFHQSTSFSAAEYLSAAMSFADLTSQTPVIRIIFHNLWAFREKDFTIASFTKNDPFFVAYVMSVVKNFDRLVDLLFLSNNNNDNCCCDTSLLSDEQVANLFGTPKELEQQQLNNNNNNSKTSSSVSLSTTPIAENHWIGLMIKLLRSCVRFLRNHDEKEIEIACQLLYGFQSGCSSSSNNNNKSASSSIHHQQNSPSSIINDLPSVFELRRYMTSFLQRFGSHAINVNNINIQLSSSFLCHFDNAESILDWLRSLHRGAFHVWQDENLVRFTRFLITLCVLPMRPIISTSTNNNNNNNANMRNLTASVDGSEIVGDVFGDGGETEQDFKKKPKQQQHTNKKNRHEKNKTNTTTASRDYHQHAASNNNTANNSNLHQHQRRRGKTGGRK